MEVILALVNSPLLREAVGLFIAVLLIVVIDRRLNSVVKSVERIEAVNTVHMAHQTSRMAEIRGDIKHISETLGGLLAGK